MPRTIATETPIPIPAFAALLNTLGDEVDVLFWDDDVDSDGAAGGVVLIPIVELVRVVDVDADADAVVDVEAAVELTAFETVFLLVMLK